jgi:hypothetical protein
VNQPHVRFLVPGVGISMENTKGDGGRGVRIGAMRRSVVRVADVVSTYLDAVVDPCFAFTSQGSAFGVPVIRLRTGGSGTGAVNVLVHDWPETASFVVSMSGGGGALSPPFPELAVVGGETGTWDVLPGRFRACPRSRCRTEPRCAAP